MACVNILRGSRRYDIGVTESLVRRIIEYRRGSNYITRRFGEELLLVAAKRVASMTEARSLECQLKRKKNPQLVISALHLTEKLTQ
jgi:predicted GIY-YIG superfamily endonuclease